MSESGTNEAAATDEQEDRSNVVLMTRGINESDIQEAGKLGLEIETAPLLDYRFPKPPELRIMARELNRYNLDGVIITSRNGAIGLKRLVNEGLELKDNWTYYAVGQKTAEKIELLFGLDVEVPDNQESTALAELILEKQSENSRLLYLCGNLAKENLPNALKKHGIEVKTFEIYKTVSRRPVEFPGTRYGGVVFYSPSAVDAFDNNGGFVLEADTYFAIGPVTAAHLRSLTNKPVVVADEPSTEAILNTISSTLNSQGH